MGCDIHCYFETKTKTGWEPLFTFELSKWWYESILGDQFENGVGHILTGNDENDDPYEFLENYYKNLSKEEALEKYGEHPLVSFDYVVPLLKNKKGEHEEYNFRFNERDYYWFGILAGVRRPAVQQFKVKGFPKNASKRIKQIRKQWGLAGHTDSWIMVEDLINLKNKPITKIEKESIKEYYQSPSDYIIHPFYIEWLTTFIPNPKKTRMVFWFDN